MSPFPLFLKNIALTDFRNIASAELSFCRSANVILGHNAQGKTNLLEAIHVATSLTSFRAAKNDELVRFGAKVASVRGQINSDLGDLEVEVELRPGSRRVHVDGKALRSSSTTMDRIKAILFTPEDLQMVRGAPSLRRRYLDTAISKLYPRYVSFLRDYGKIIAQKSILLADPRLSGELLEVWNSRQVDLGSRIILARARFIDRIRGKFGEAWNEIGSSGVGISIRYASSVAEFAELKGQELRHRFAAELDASSHEERRRRRVVVGPHRDDVEVLLNGVRASSFASQGQARVIAVALKIAEFELLAEELDQVPIFLLDDVSSELDSYRNRSLLDYVSRSGCQLFITTALEERQVVDNFDMRKCFRVVSGTVRELEGPGIQ